MKTEVEMKRILFGHEISQKSKSELLSATDLVKAGNAWRISNGFPEFNFYQWRQSNNTREFIVELEKNMVLLLSVEGVEDIIHGFILFYSWIWLWR